ncbi:MAG TPA: hypothetical protein VF471_07120 [Pseudoxanthomonas sp.]
MEISNEPYRREISDISAGRLWRWGKYAWHLFRSAPLRSMGLALLPIVSEAIVQLIPVAGVVLSKFSTPLMASWVLAMVHNRASIGIFDPKYAGQLWLARLRQLLLLSLASVGVFAFQLLAGLLIAGQDQTIALAAGNVANLDLSRIQMASILVSGLVPATLLAFASPLLLLSGHSVGYAMRESFFAVLRYWRPMLAYALVSAALLAGMLWQIWMLLLYLPIALFVGYAAYRDIFLGGPGHSADDDA